MAEANWLDYLTAFGSIATPLMVLALSAVGWRFKVEVERKIELENQLRDDRVAIYNKILEPFIIILTSDAAWAQDKKQKGKNKYTLATSRMLSLEYREQGFKLSLIGSDNVVKAYNNLMQYFYAADDNVTTDPDYEHTREMLRLIGSLLLEIRRSMGNDATSLDCWDMCEWWMSDARKLRSGEAIA